MNAGNKKTFIGDYTDQILDMILEMDSLKRESSKIIDEKTKEIETISIEMASLRKELEENVRKYEDHLNEIQQTTVIYQGEQGEAGDDGYSPIPGVDFPLPQDGKSVNEEEVVKKVLALVPPPEKGKDAIVDEEKIVKTVLAKLPKVKEINHDAIVEKVFEMLKEKKLSVEHIGDFTDGLEQKLRPMRSLMAGFRGGGDVVTAGSNITITTNSDGKKIIASTSGGGTFIDNEVVAGTGTAFTLANTPIAGTMKLYAGRNRLYPTTDYSITGTAITTVLSWSTGDLIADYQK